MSMFSLPFCCLSLAITLTIASAFQLCSNNNNMNMKRTSTSTRASSLNMMLREIEDIQKNTKTFKEFYKEKLLIDAARVFFEEASGFSHPCDGDLLSEEFVFRGPVIGPLCKKDYMKTLGTIKMYEAISDMKPNSFGYCIDPMQKGRVWVFTRYTGINTGDFNLGLKVKATGKPIKSAVEANSITFDELGKVKLLTVGYIADIDDPGNKAAGFGAAVGVFNALGISLPKGKLFSVLQGIIYRLGNKIDSPLLNDLRGISREEDIPDWYKSYVPRRNGAAQVPFY